MVSSRIFARAIAVVVIAAGCVATGPEPAHAVPAAPGGLTTTPANPPVLSWNPVAAATKYEVQVDDDPGFVSPEFTSTTVNTRAVPTVVLHAGDQFWRVRAFDASNLAGPWAQGSFPVAPVPAPTALAPDGATLQQPGSPPLLSWDEVRGAESYVVQLDDEEDPEYVGSKEYTTKVTSLVPDPLPTGDAGESYRWRVKAIRDSGVESAFSTDAIFTVTPLDTVTLTSPADGATVQDVVLDWQPLPGAAWYELQVSTNDSFSPSTIIDDRTGSKKILGTRYSPPVTYDNNTYYWRVRAIDTSGNASAWTSSQRNFARNWAAAEFVPTPTAPADGAQVVGPALHLQWTPVAHASTYEVQMSPDPNFSPDPVNLHNCIVVGTTYTPGTFQINDLSGTTSQKDPNKCTPTAGQRTYWRVRPLDLPFLRAGTATNGLQGIYSARRSFTYTSGPADGGAITLSPANGATVDVPVLSWSAVQGASSYTVNVWDNTGNRVVASQKTYATSFVPAPSTALSAAKSPYEWSVVATGADGVPKTLEMHRTFSISGTDPDEGPWAGTAAPLAPLTANDLADTTRRPPLMAWEPFPGAAYYRVNVGPAGTGTLFAVNNADQFGADVKLRHPAVADTYTWLLDAGDYDWQVSAYAADNTLLDVGPTATLRIAGLDPVTGVRLALDGNTFGADGNGGFTAPLSCAAQTPEVCPDAPATPVISWDPVPDAGLYIVYLSEDPEFTNMVEDLTSLAATTNTRWAPNRAQKKAALAESLAGGSYFIHVRPCWTPTKCGPRPVSTVGMATNKFRKKSPPAVLESPLDGKVVGTTEVVFDWQDYRATNAAATWTGSGGEASTQSAQWYRIQVATSNTFSQASLVDKIEVDQSTYTAFAKLYPEGPLFWRVQAIDGDNNDLAWSETRMFTKTSPATVPTAPAAGAVVHGAPVFRWQPAPFAVGYEVEIYKNDDATFSSGNRVVSKSVKQTAFVSTEVIPFSTIPYVWRVRTVDATGNKGPWSTPRRFTSAGEQPTVVGPATNSYLQGNQILLRWAETNGAASYRVELQSPTGSPTRTDTKATAYAPTQSLVDGTWQWKVDALSPSNTLLGSSGWSKFVIDENGPRVMAVAPSTVRAKSNLVVTFNEAVKNVSGQTLYLTRNGTRRKIAAKVTLSADKLRATLNPGARLRRSTGYTITMTAGITDLRGNRLARTTRSIFVR